MKQTLFMFGVVGLMGFVAINCWAGALDGTRAKVRVVPSETPAGNNDKGFDDTLSFANGKFTSTAFQAKGFQPGVYNGEREQNEAEFEVEQTNEVGEVVNWLGNIRGDHVGGHVHWAKKNGTKVSYYFNGTEESNTGSSTNHTAAVPAVGK
jgi:hypothetical protein